MGNQEDDQDDLLGLIQLVPAIVGSGVITCCFIRVWAIPRFRSMLVCDRKEAKWFNQLKRKEEAQFGHLDACKLWFLGQTVTYATILDDSSSPCVRVLVCVCVSWFLLVWVSCSRCNGATLHPALLLGTLFCWEPKQMTLAFLLPRIPSQPKLGRTQPQDQDTPHWMHHNLWVRHAIHT